MNSESRPSNALSSSATNSDPGMSLNISGFNFSHLYNRDNFHDPLLISQELIRNRNIKTHHLGVNCFPHTSGLFI